MRNRTKQLILPLLALAGILLIGALSLTDSTPAFAADGAGTLRNNSDDYSLGGIAKGDVRTITFSNKIPTTGTCWNAGVSGYESTVVGCATTSTEDSSLYDVTYGADGAYPKFPADSSSMFYGKNTGGRYYSKLVSFSNFSQVDMSNVTDMSYMFRQCSKLKSLDVSGWDTSKVTDMSGMFFSCLNVDSLDVSKWNTANVTDLSDLFGNCSGLTKLDVSNWNTSKVTDMSSMFWACEGLSSLNVSKWDTANVTDMSGLFANCLGLTELDVSKWNTSNVTDMGQMFMRCPLSSLDVSNFDTSKVTDMSSMFMECPNLTSINMSGWVTPSVTDISYMFEDCPQLTELDLSGWDTSKVTATSGSGADGSRYMLSGLSKLQTLKLGAGFTRSLGYGSCRLGSPYAPDEKTGYTVTGKWKDSATSVAYASSAIPTKTAATYVADYAPNTYTIQFDRNNGSGTMSDQSFTYDKAQNLTLNTFTRSGWKFTGWKDEAGKTYTDGQEVKNLTATNNASFVLTAQWEPDTYTVTFDPNNGTGTMDSQTFTHDTEQALTPSTFTRTGWYFTGWNTSKDGTGTTYADGEKVVNLTTAGNTITLYAQWKHVSTTMPTTGNGHLLPLLIITSIIGMVTAIILLRKQD